MLNYGNNFITEILAYNNSEEKFKETNLTNLWPIICMNEATLKYFCEDNLIIIIRKVSDEPYTKFYHAAKRFLYLK